MHAREIKVHGEGMPATESDVGIRGEKKLQVIQFIQFIRIG